LFRILLSTVSYLENDNASISILKQIFFSLFISATVGIFTFFLFSDRKGESKAYFGFSRDKRECYISYAAS